MSTPTLARSTFTTSRLLEFFTENELTMQIGHPRELWPLALLKELIDNALDACETAGTAPEITVTVEPDAVSVQDNGPGLPATTLERSLNYLVRVSDKNHYVSPSRGQLGNALKCLWAAPFVVDGEHGCVEVLTVGLRHTITVRLDHIAQEPDLRHEVTPDPTVKNGTLVRMLWPEIASYLDGSEMSDFYKTRPGAPEVLAAYAAMNPHATFRLTVTGTEDGEDEEDGAWSWQATAPTWAKWKPSSPTSAHWYTPERLRDLIAAYLAEERATPRARTVRDLIAEFHGLSGTAKQKAVAEQAGLARARLADLASDGDVDLARVATLLDAMQAQSRPVKPAALGIIGEAHVRAALMTEGCAPDSVKYKRSLGAEAANPFVLEVGFGVRRAGTEDIGRRIIAGINWAPALGLPFPELEMLLSANHVQRQDPVVLLVHVARPSVQFADRGKGRLAEQHGRAR